MTEAGTEAETGAEEGTSSSSGRNLPVAIGVGLVLATVMLGGLFHSAEAFTLVIAALAGVGAFETGRTFREAGRPFAVPVVLVAVAASLFGTYRAGAAGQFKPGRREGP